MGAVDHLWLVAQKGQDQSKDQAGKCRVEVDDVGSEALGEASRGEGKAKPAKDRPVHVLEGFDDVQGNACEIANVPSGISKTTFSAAIALDLMRRDFIEVARDAACNILGEM